MDDDQRVERSVVESMQQQLDDEFADYDFRPAEEVFGADGDALVAWWANALAERALVHPDHYDDVAAQVRVEFATAPVPTMHFSFYGRDSWHEDWGATIDAARELLKEALSDYAGQVKADRGYGGGHHQWDDPIDA